MSLIKSFDLSGATGGLSFTDCNNIVNYNSCCSCWEYSTDTMKHTTSNIMLAENGVCVSDRGSSEIGEGLSGSATSSSSYEYNHGAENTTAVEAACDFTGESDRASANYSSTSSVDYTLANCVMNERLDTSSDDTDTE